MSYTRVRPRIVRCMYIIRNIIVCVCKCVSAMRSYVRSVRNETEKENVKKKSRTTPVAASSYVYIYIHIIQYTYIRVYYVVL